MCASDCISPLGEGGGGGCAYPTLGRHPCPCIARLLSERPRPRGGGGARCGCSGRDHGRRRRPAPSDQPLLPGWSETSTAPPESSRGGSVIGTSDADRRVRDLRA
eukprot:scaffold15232_cov115-Isochrysis_galbana.AAC.2